MRRESQIMTGNLLAGNWSDRRRHELEDIGLHSARQFCAIVDRERALVDRNHHAFSLLLFDLGAYSRNWQRMRTFARLGASRLRKTDMMGWMDGQRAGILLPFTPFRGARRVADHIVAELSEHGMEVPCIVHTYPTDEDGTGEGGGEAGSTDRIAEDRSPERRRDAAIRAVAPHAAGGQDHPAPEQDLKAMIVPPLPRWKRAMDIAVSSLALVLASPVMLAVALLVKLVSPRGPVLFRQQRVGFLGHPFMCFKFRTMHADSGESVHRQHLQKLIQSDVPMTKLDTGLDARLIPLGRLLRASGVDELPQLFNVLRGDMSLIGPRPCLKYEYDRFQRWHQRRFDTMPGLTGLWQVSGKNRTTFTEMMRLDISYAKGRSLLRDIRIMALTLPAVVSQVLDLKRVRRSKVL